MGNFFTSTQIYNEGMVKSKKFIDMFCKAMKKEGYVTCEGDESEKSYILRFADNCKWVTIASEEYDEGNAAADAGKIAKMLGTTCVNTNVIDSDCAIMEMYGSDGKKADTLIMGRADDYFGENIPLPAENAWKPFLTEGSSWEKLCDIVKESENYTFVEEGLAKLAPILGMDERNISFSADEATEDEHTVFLDFKKAAAKEKKLTFVSAFKLVFGEMLEAMGYKYFKKGKYPYFVKVINNEILHIISYRHISSSIVGHKAMEIHGGAISLYRRKIDLTGEPTCWLSTIHSYYNGEYNKLAVDLIRYECNMSDNESLTKDMKRAAELVKEFILSNIENVVTLESYVKYAKSFYFIDADLCELDKYENNHSTYRNESYLLVLTYDDDDGIKRMEDYITNQLNNIPQIICNNPEKLKERENEIREQENIDRLNYITLRNRLMNDKESFKRIESILQKNKENNIELLKSYGLFQEQDKIKAEDKKEKKLTLNAAFKQVYGEMLEPLEFKLVKSRYPYYVRIINNEILHVITYKLVSHVNNYTEFNIIGGIATVYRPKLSFDLSQRENINWLESLSEFYRKTNLFNYDENYYNALSKFICKDENIKDTLIESMKEVNNIMLPVLSRVTNINECIEYFLIFKSDMNIDQNMNDFENETARSFYNEGLLYVLTDKYGEFMEKKSEYIFAEAANKLKAGQPALYIDSDGKVQRYTTESYNMIYDKFKNEKMQRLQHYEEFYNNNEWLKIANEEISRRKKLNSKLILFQEQDKIKAEDKKEKKLTLNAAFTQIFGAELEPLGFRRIKGRNLYFARVMNGDILHIIGVCDMTTHIYGFGGITTLYNTPKQLGITQSYRANDYWLMSANEIYKIIGDNSSEEPDPRIYTGYYYSKDNPDSIIEALKDNLLEFQKWILPFLDKVTNIHEFFDFKSKTLSCEISLPPLPLPTDEKTDYAVQFLFDDPMGKLKKYYDERDKVYAESYNSLINKVSPETIKRIQNRRKRNKENSLNTMQAFVSDEALKKQTLDELENRRKANIEILQKYGIM